MTQEQKNNPLHGVKLEALLKELLDAYGWDELALEINLNCFKKNPSIKSSLKFLRRTEWAREKVERFYLYDYKKLPRPGEDQYDIPPRKRMVSKTGQPKAPHNIPDLDVNTRENVPNLSVNTDTNEASVNNVAPTKKPSNGFNPWDKSRHNKG